MRATPAGHEVQDLERDIIIAIPTDGTEVSTQRLKLSDYPLSRNARLKLALGGASEAGKAIARRQSRIELVGD